jgi:MFS family permease
MGIFNRQEVLANTPKEVLNWRLYWSVAVFGKSSLHQWKSKARKVSCLLQGPDLTIFGNLGILGASRGLDEGLVGGMVSLKSFKSEFPLAVGTKEEQANRVSNITSMVQLGSVAGALLAFVLCDKIGRVRSLQALTCLWALGFIIVVTSFGNIGQILAGRFIAGTGIGMTTVVGPTYLVEVAPKAIRGMLTNIFAGAVYLGVMIAYFSNWGSSINISNSSRAQWVIPQSVHLMFAG